MSELGREKPQRVEVGQRYAHRNYDWGTATVVKQRGEIFDLSWSGVLENDGSPRVAGWNVEAIMSLRFLGGPSPGGLGMGERPKPAKGQRWRDGKTIVTLKEHLNDCGKERDGSDRWRWQVETENGSDCGYLDYYFEPGGILEFVDHGTPTTPAPAPSPAPAPRCCERDCEGAGGVACTTSRGQFATRFPAAAPVVPGKPSEPRGYGGKTWAEHVAGDQNMAVGMRQRDHENPSAGRRLRAMLEVGRVPKPEPYVCPVSDEDLLPDAGTSYRSPR